MLNTKSLKNKINIANMDIFRNKQILENLSLSKYNLEEDIEKYDNKIFSDNYKNIDIEPSKKKQFENIIIEANETYNEIYNDNKDSLKNSLKKNILENEINNIVQNENTIIGKNNDISKNISKCYWNEDDNCYIIIENDEIECIITNEDIIINIFDNQNAYIKKYIFILGVNVINQTNEFNFLKSIFTSNFEIMIKIQNYIYEKINNLDQLEDNKDTLIIFYYQLIIWLFKNMIIFEKNNDSNKILKFYSCLTYRFSSIILKNIMNIQNIDMEKKEELDFSKINLLSKIENFYNIQDKQLSSNLIIKETELNSSNSFDNQSSNITENMHEEIESTIIESEDEIESENGIETNNDIEYVEERDSENRIENWDEIANISSDNLISEIDKFNKNIESENILKKYNLKGKNGNKMINLNDLFTEEDIDNGYLEINLEYDKNIIDKEGKKNNSNNYKIIKEINKNIKEIDKNSKNSDKNKKYESNSYEKSYNINSALKNGQLFKFN